NLNNRVVKIWRAWFAIDRRGFVNRRLHRWLRDAIDCPNSIARTLKIREPIPQVRPKRNRGSHAEIPCRDRSAACKSKKAADTAATTGESGARIIDRVYRDCFSCGGTRVACNWFRSGAADTTATTGPAHRACHKAPPVFR